MGLLELARGEAIRMFKQDPGLSRPEHLLLQREVAQLWQKSVSGVES